MLVQQQPAARKLASGLSENPLDDLVSIFGGAGMGFGAGPMAGSFGAPPMQAQAQAQSPPLGVSPAFAMSSPPLAPQAKQQQPQEDLLGLF
jgi:hypothetical protein